MEKVKYSEGGRTHPNAPEFWPAHAVWYRNIWRHDYVFDVRILQDVSFRHKVEPAYIWNSV